MNYEHELGLSTAIPTHLTVLGALRFLVTVVLGVSGVVAAGIAYSYGIELVGTSVPILLAGWVMSIGVALALPFLVVRLMSALLAAFRL
ncbi:hypothetical protein [Haladaptatus sp. NG-SE-30]